MKRKMKMKRKSKGKRKNKWKNKIKLLIYWFIKLKKNQISQKEFKKFKKNQMQKNNSQIKFIKNCIIN